MKTFLISLTIAMATGATAYSQSPSTPKSAAANPAPLNQSSVGNRPRFRSRIVQGRQPYVCYYYVQPPYYRYYCQPVGRSAVRAIPMGVRYQYNQRGGGAYYRQVGPYYWYYYWR